MIGGGHHTISVNGLAHWVRVAGAQNSGTPLVLVHGGPGASAYAWEAIGDRIAEKVPVVFYDQRGCGRSERPLDPSTYTMAQLVADLDALRAALGLAQIIPWGVSYGSVIAAEYSVAHPDRVSHLIMQAPPIVGPLHPGRWALFPAAVDAVAGPATRVALHAALTDIDDPVRRLWIAFQTLETDLDARSRLMFHDPKKAAAADAAAADGPDYGFNEELARALIGTERSDLVDELAALDLPALVMVGLWDRNCGVDTARDLAERLSRGRLHLFARSAHLPHDEEPTEYVQAIHTFVHG